MPSINYLSLFKAKNPESTAQLGRGIGANGTHDGRDYIFNKGTKQKGWDVPAAANGKVIYSGNWGRGYGNTVIIEHDINGQKVYTTYAHLDDASNMPAIGTNVAQGDAIGQTGNSGVPGQSPHLHMETATNMEYVKDPVTGEMKPNISGDKDRWRVDPEQCLFPEQTLGLVDTPSPDDPFIPEYVPYQKPLSDLSWPDILGDWGNEGLIGSAGGDTLGGTPSSALDIAGGLCGVASEVPTSSPIVLDLDGDGISLVALEDSAAYFDLDNDGFREKTQWVAATDGLLALDANGNGRIDDKSELFGDEAGYADGYAKLRAHDANADGVIDA